jgi:hypothetical protein
MVLGRKGPSTVWPVHKEQPKTERVTEMTRINPDRWVDESKFVEELCEALVQWTSSGQTEELDKVLVRAEGIWPALDAHGIFVEFREAVHHSECQQSEMPDRLIASMMLLKAIELAHADLITVPDVVNNVFVNTPYGSKTFDTSTSEFVA